MHAHMHLKTKIYALKITKYALKKIEKKFNFKLFITIDGLHILIHVNI